MLCSEFLLESGFTPVSETSETLYGRFNTYLFNAEPYTLSDIKFYKFSSSLSIPSHKGKIMEFFENKKDANLIDDFDVDENFTFSVRDSEETIKDTITQLISLLEELEASNYCVHCKKTEDLNFYKVNGTLTVMCSACERELAESIEIEKNKRPKYVSAFFLSLIGAIIGTIGWILLGLIGFYASFAGYLIGLGAIKGYKLTKSKITKKSVILISIAIVIAVLFAEYIGIYISFKRADPAWSFYGYVILTPIIYTDLEFLKSIALNLVFGILFGFLGTRGTLKNLSDEASSLKDFTIEKLN